MYSLIQMNEELQDAALECAWPNWLPLSSVVPYGHHFNMAMYAIKEDKEFGDLKIITMAR